MWLDHGVLRDLPLLLIPLSPCDLTPLYYVRYVYVNLYTHFIRLHYTLEYNTIPGGRVTTAGWCIDWWYTWCGDGSIGWSNGVSVERLVASVPIDMIPHGSWGGAFWLSVYMVDGADRTKRNALWCSGVEAYTHTYTLYWVAKMRISHTQAR